METLITKQALHATESLAQTAAALARLLDQVMNDIQSVDSEFQEQVQEAVRQTEAYERDQLRQELQRIQSEHERALAETDEAAAIALELQIATAVDRVRVELTKECDRLRQELEQATNAGAPTPAAEQPSIEIEAVNAEVARVGSLIEAISLVVEDPDTELSAVIRKNAERTELEAYLRGLRFRKP